MTVRGLFETHLTVADLARSVAFYRDVVGLPVALELPERGHLLEYLAMLEGPARPELGIVPWSQRGE
jgi:lactoylglutathione lyase